MSPVFLYLSTMIEVNNLTKLFGELTAVNNISFKVNKGEFYGLLGPNGAGKSTTIQILSGLFSPDKGTFSINGKTPDQHQAFKKSIGVVPQELSLYDELTIDENLRFWGKLNGVTGVELKNRIAETLAFIQLEKRRTSRVKHLSGGMKRRVNIAAALIHNPEVIFMDEPTVGIDPQSRNMMYEMLEQLKEEKRTIVYTSHYMEEVERLSTRIGIIDEGKIITEGTLEEIREKHMNNRKIIITTDCKTLPATFALESLEFPASFTDGILEVETAEINRAIAQISALLDQHHIDIKYIDIRKANLESIFLKLTGKELRE